MKKKKKKPSKAMREIDALNKMMENVLRSKSRRRRKKKKALKESGMWDDLEMDDDILDTEDDY